MEFISSSQLAKYDAILNEITSNIEESYKLKGKVDRETDKIIAAKLSLIQRNLPSISHVIVKIFDNIDDIFNLYDNIDRQLYTNKFIKENCKFYLIEIYIKNLILDKLVQQQEQWMLNICIRSKNLSVSKTVSLRDSSPITKIIPVEETVIDCVVESYLWLPPEIMLDLFVVPIDVSYHFKNYQNTTNINDNNSLLSRLLKFSKLYENHSIEEIRSPNTEYQLYCNFPKKSDLLFAILKNCYHNFDSTSLSSSQNTTSSLQIQFALGRYRNNSIHFNEHTKVLKIESDNLHGLLLLKKYFIKNLSTKPISSERFTYYVQVRSDCTELLLSFYGFCVLL